MDLEHVWCLSPKENSAEYESYQTVNKVVIIYCQCLGNCTQDTKNKKLLNLVYSIFEAELAFICIFNFKTIDYLINRKMFVFLYKAVTYKHILSYKDYYIQHLYYDIVGTRPDVRMLKSNQIDFEITIAKRGNICMSCLRQWSFYPEADLINHLRSTLYATIIAWWSILML
jgi:hypothetical protein